jgi:hypothetical protein
MVLSYFIPVLRLLRMERRKEFGALIKYIL